MSRGDVLLLIAVLAAFGIVVSGYLAWQWYEAANASWCDLNDYWSCSRVRESPFAAVGGVPTAFIGVGGFAALLALAVLGLRGSEVPGPWSLDRWILVFAALGSFVGLGLTFVELFVIEAVCVLCAIGFALDVLILFVAPS